MKYSLRKHRLSIPLKKRMDNSIRVMIPKSPLEKYTYLRNIQDWDEDLFYGLLMSHTNDLMPIVYTPTVGLACQKWSNIITSMGYRGLTITAKDKGRISSLLDDYHKGM